MECGVRPAVDEPDSIAFEAKAPGAGLLSVIEEREVSVNLVGLLDGAQP